MNNLTKLVQNSFNPPYSLPVYSLSFYHTRPTNLTKITPLTNRPHSHLQKSYVALYEQKEIERKRGVNSANANGAAHPISILNAKPAYSTGADSSTPFDQKKSIPTTKIHNTPPLPPKPNSRIVLVIGPPGSGKGTLCQSLTSLNPAFKHISIGEEIRRILLNPNHILTQRYADIVRTGGLLPDNVVIEIVSNIIRASHTSNSVILLDGYPRNLKQLIEFQQHFSDDFTIIHLDIDKETAIERILNRGENRADDKLNTILKRLEVFETNTQPMLDQLMATQANTIITLAKNPIENALNPVTKEASILHQSQSAYQKLNQHPEIFQALSTHSQDRSEESETSNS